MTFKFLLNVVCKSFMNFNLSSGLSLLLIFLIPTLSAMDLADFSLSPKKKLAFNVSNTA